jgi:FdrA protein
MPDEVRKLLNSPLVVINLGVDQFAKSLEDQEVEVVRVNWRPPAGGDQEMIKLLDQLL